VGLHIFEDQGDDLLEIAEGFVGGVSPGGRAFESRAVGQIRLATIREPIFFEDDSEGIRLEPVMGDLRLGHSVFTIVSRDVAVKGADRQREPSLPHDQELAHLAHVLSPSLRNFPQNDLVLLGIYS
jgi:hypothetical protein